MPDKPFVINDRRKFTADGDLRPDAPPNTPKATAEPSAETGLASEEPGSDTGKPHKEPIAFPSSTSKAPAEEPDFSEEEPDEEPMPAARAHETIAFPSSGLDDTESERDSEPGDEEASLPPLTAEQTEQASRAYNATVDRLDIAMRANNLGAEPMPEMTFDRLVQSLYMQALLQLGAAAEPGRPPQVDILGGRQTIDMLGIIADKVKGNLTDAEDKLLESALFEIRMGFLEVTQALARQAAARQPGGPGAGLGTGPGGKGPGIVR